MSSVCENKRFVERLAVHTTYTHRYSGHEERDGRDKQFPYPDTHGHAMKTQLSWRLSWVIDHS